MKSLADRASQVWLPVLSLFTCCGLLLGVNSQSQAQDVTLQDGNATAIISPGSSAGMHTWQVDNVNQLNQQWFWYRLGNSGPAYSIDHIGAAVVSGQSSGGVSLTYTSAGQFSVRTTYTLTGGQPGSGTSDIAESIRINNLSGAPLDFHFFQYSDFTLAGTPNDDYTQLFTGAHGLYNTADVSDATYSLVETVFSPGANHGEVATHGATLGEFANAGFTTLNDQAGPLGPGYYTWAFEWDPTIAAGGSFIISKDKNLQFLPVPEPSIFALALLGFAFCGVRNRRAKG